jgi:hypothetical protein
VATSQRCAPSRYAYQIASIERLLPLPSTSTNSPCPLCAGSYQTPLWQAAMPEAPVPASSATAGCVSRTSDIVPSLKPA